MCAAGTVETGRRVRRRNRGSPTCEISSGAEEAAAFGGFWMARGWLPGRPLTDFSRRRPNPSASSGQVLPLPLERMKNGATGIGLHPKVLAGVETSTLRPLTECRGRLLPLPQERVKNGGRGGGCSLVNWVPGRPLTPTLSPRRGSKSRRNFEDTGCYAKVSGEAEEPPRLRSRSALCKGLQRAREQERPWRRGRVASRSGLPWGDR